MSRHADYRVEHLYAIDHERRLEASKHGQVIHPIDPQRLVDKANSHNRGRQRAALRAIAKAERRGVLRRLQP